MAETPLKKQVCYYYDREIGDYYYGPGHPMKPHRIRMTHNLLLHYGLYQKMQVYTPHKVSMTEMTQFHSDEYINFLERINLSNMKNYKNQMQKFNLGGTDCPLYDGLYDFCQISTGGTLAAASKLNDKSADICINWAGGLHHAKKSNASGFCYVNDIVIGILELLKCSPRVLYIDIDVHHGDGVEEAFYATDRVMTVSFHKYGNFFPGTGHVQDTGAEGGKLYSVNVPLKDGITDDNYESMFVPIITKAIQAYHPCVIVMQCGADSLARDKLGCFNLTIKGHGRCVEYVRSYGLPLLLLGGGGYTTKNVSRCWTYETAIALGIKLSNDLPDHDYISSFEPDFKLHISPSEMKDENTREYLEKTRNRVLNNLRMITHVPSVQVQDIPTDSMRIESDDEDSDNPDELNPRSNRQTENVFSESEGEEMAPVTNVQQRNKNRNRPLKKYPPAKKRAILDPNRFYNLIF